MRPTMTILTALRRLHGAGRPTTLSATSDRGGVSAPALAATVAVLVLVIGIAVTGSHEIILDAMRDALDNIGG